MPPRTSERQLGRARKMRREQTYAEDILWRALRDRQLGAKFRRQVPVGAFIADFACVEAKLIVEVDGPSRGGGAGCVAGSVVSGRGWRVVRVTNAMVTGGGDLVLAPIRAALAMG